MQTPTLKTPVSKCISLGLYCQSMLAHFPDNAVLVDVSASIGAATSALSAAQATYAQSILALIPKRVAVRFADYSSDNIVRAVQRNAESADGEKNGRIASAIFPNGVTPIVRPIGKSQCDEMRALEGRIEAAAAHWPDALTEKAKVTAARTAYEAALEARRAGLANAADLRAKRDAAREDFLDVYAATAARVKEQFPRNRPKQDLFFDRIAEAPMADDEDDGDDADPGAILPPAPPADATPPVPPA